MEDSGFNEKLSIRNSARSLKKYGSTSNHIKRNETLIKHNVSANDTLQGIALKYGVTTEQIRRANRLWATDSLFLREHLMIPVPSNSPFSPTGTGTESSPFPPSSSSDPIEVQSNLQSPTTHASIAGSLGEKTIDEFLGKIDSSIAITKNEVKKCQGNSEFLSDIDVGYERRKPAMSRMRLAANNNTTPDLLTTTPTTVVMTQGRKVRTSLQRLAQQQDEIFEL